MGIFQANNAKYLSHFVFYDIIFYIEIYSCLGKVIKMKNLNECVGRLFESRSLTNLIVKVGVGDKTLCELIKTTENRDLNSRTLFNMASVTKIMCTTTLALIAIDRGLLSLQDHLSKFFDAPRAQELTVFNLLTHTIGIGHKNLTGHTAGYESVGEYILNIPADIPTGKDVLYSCPGFILLGRVLEKIFGDRLDRLFTRYVAEPLGMKNTGFLPDKNQDIVNANLKPEEAGIVHDYNCRHLGGVSGNAGLFSNLDDVMLYVNFLLSKGTPLISEKTFDMAAQNHTVGMRESRGLGFVFVDDRYIPTGGLLPEGSIGHGGYTGQTVFAHPESGFYAVLLSDATVCSCRKHGREISEETKQIKHDIHAAIKKDLGL